MLLEKKIGEGRVLLFASGLDNLTNDFPLHPVFVPFVEQTARYLSGTEQRSGSRVVDSFLELRTAKEQAVGVEVVDPDGHRPLSLKEATSAQSYQLTRAGFYELRLANGRQDVIGVNPDRRESDLDVIPDDVLALWRGNGHGEQRRLRPRVPARNRPSRTACGGTYASSIRRGALPNPCLRVDIWARRGRTHEHADQLNSYIQQLERRLRLGALLRGAAILTSVALAPPLSSF